MIYPPSASGAFLSLNIFIN